MEFCFFNKFDSQGNTCSSNIHPQDIPKDAPRISYATETHTDNLLPFTTLTDAYLEKEGPRYNLSFLCSGSSDIAAVNSDELISRSINADLKISVSPNPVSSILNLSIQNAKASVVYITISNMEGKILYSQQLTAISGSLNKQLEVQQFQKGMYILKAVNGNEQRVIKFVKIN